MLGKPSTMLDSDFASVLTSTDCLSSELFVHGGSWHLFKFFQVRIVKGAKSNIFTCKLCAGKLFLKSTRIPSRRNHKMNKVQHFYVQTVMHRVKILPVTVLDASVVAA